jgi:hypothetical protein
MSLNPGRNSDTRKKSIFPKNSLAWVLTPARMNPVESGNRPVPVYELSLKLLFREELLRQTQRIEFAEFI